MALANHALITVAEAHQELGDNDTGTADTARIEAVIALCTASIETYLRRQIRYRGTEFTEYSSLRERGVFIFTIQRPVFVVTEVKESDLRDWANATALVSGTDYIANLSRGRFERLSSGWSADLRAASAEWYPSGIPSGAGGLGGPSWAVGPKTVRIKYRAGYRGLDALPAEAAELPGIFTAVCRELFALKWREIKRGAQGISATTDETGNFTKFGPAKLTNEMKEALRDELRLEETACQEID